MICALRTLKDGGVHGQSNWDAKPAKNRFLASLGMTIAKVLGEEELAESGEVESVEDVLAVGSEGFDGDGFGGDFVGVVFEPDESTCHHTAAIATARVGGFAP